MTDAAARDGRIHLPALLTIARVVLVAPIVVLTVRRTDAASWVATALFAVAAITDGLDGLAARRMGLVSKAGELWDPLADKALVLGTMIALVTVHRFAAWAAIVIIIREIAITWLRIAADRRGNGFPASKPGKLKTGAQLLAVLFGVAPARAISDTVVIVAVIVAVVLTVVSGVQYLARVKTLLHGERHAR